MESKKYELTEETIKVGDKILHRIRALRSFETVNAGDLGGYIENEHNLSHQGNAWVGGNARVVGNVLVVGNAWVEGNARAVGNARVERNQDVLWISHIGSRNDTTTFFRTENEDIAVICGCFYGTLDEFSEKVRRTHGDNLHGKCYQLAIEMAKLKIGGSKDDQ